MTLHTSLTRRAALVAMVASTASPGGAWAQTYPQRPVRLVVPFPAGTGTDLTARLMAQQLQAALGQPFVVDNKPGAGGSIGAMEVVRAAPDGHTLLFSSNSAAASNVALLKSMPYDPARDLTLVSGIGESALVLMVRTDHPARTLDDFLDMARKQPGKLNGGYGSSSSQMSIALLNKLARLDTLLVPYKGIPLAVNDVIAGTLDFTFVDINNALAQAKGGKLRALGVTRIRSSDTVVNHRFEARLQPGPVRRRGAPLKGSERSRHRGGLMSIHGGNTPNRPRSAARAQPAGTWPGRETRDFLGS